MNDLNIITENINKRNFDVALKHCDDLENTKNAFIINNFRGVIFFLEEKLDLAEEKFLISHSLDSKFEDPIKNLYMIYLKKNNHQNVLEYAKKLVQINYLSELYNYQLAYAYELNSDNEQAIKHYEKCLKENSKIKGKALNNIGGIYLRNNKPKTSLKYFMTANDIIKGDKIIINNIFLNYVRLKDILSAEKYYSICEKIDNNYIEFLYNKAQYLILREEFDQAIDILLKYKNNLKFLIILVELYFNMGKENEAKSLLKNKENEIKNNSIFFNFLGMRSLREGNFDDGWKYYENRGSKITNTSSYIKEWNGENLENKTIVVYSDQALGDSIMFSKYIVLLSKISKQVYYVVNKNIINIFNNDYINISVETNETIINKPINYKITLGSLLKFFYKEKFDLHDELIFKNKSEIKDFNDKINKNKPNVGLVWSGSFHGPNQPLRSIPLKSLEKIFDLNINYYCLQNEIWPRDKDYINKIKIIDYGKYTLPEICSVVQNLDLVIAADTAILHMSTMMNKETWGIFNIYPDWRWGALYEISPYKSLKYFKQKKFNKWDDVAEQIYDELKIKFKLN